MDYRSSSTFLLTWYQRTTMFRALSHHLYEEKFDGDKNVTMDIVNFFGQKFKAFHELTILLLPER